jgi:hypothetical protein
MFYQDKKYERDFSECDPAITPYRTHSAFHESDVLKDDREKSV